MATTQNTWGISTRDTPLPTGDRDGLGWNGPGHPGEASSPALGLGIQEGLREGFIDAKRFELRIKEKRNCTGRIAEHSASGTFI